MTPKGVLIDFISPQSKRGGKSRNSQKFLRVYYTSAFSKQEGRAGFSPPLLPYLRYYVQPRPEMVAEMRGKGEKGEGL